LAYRSYKSGTPAGSDLAIAKPQLNQQQFEPAIAVPPPPPVNNAPSPSKAQEIAELHKLVEQGALTQREFDEEKQKILKRE
ncbi:MAG: hypothetical protein LBE75_08925, partial [Burkholderiales bacterium]|nr:hypothetical protein [Burkholderiales bacterium]